MSIFFLNDMILIVISLTMHAGRASSGMRPFNWKEMTPVARLALDYFNLWVNEEAPYKTAKECQEQIDLSGFVANELSAFSDLEWRAI